jgi:hypothetical protein
LWSLIHRSVAAQEIWAFCEPNFKIYFNIFRLSAMKFSIFTVQYNFDLDKADGVTQMRQLELELRNALTRKV